MIYGKLNLDFGDGDISHHTVAVDIEDFVIVLDLDTVNERIIDILKLFVVILCLLENGRVILRLHVFNCTLVVNNCLGLSFFVPEITYGGVKHYRKTHKENQNEKYG